MGLTAACGQTTAITSDAAAGAPARPSSVTPLMGDLPVLFIENQGQMAENVTHYVQGAQSSLYFTPTGLDMALTRPDRSLHVTFRGAAPTRPTGTGPSATSVNRFIGQESSWRRNIPATTSLVYVGLWPGIDLVYTGDASHLKYTFHVRPGADASQIALAYQGATALRVTTAGDLEVVTGESSFVDERPVAWQDVDGVRVPVAVRHDAESGAEPGTFTARLPVGDYDRSRELVVDPTIVIYAGYLPGDGDDLGQSMAVDGDGAVYLTGDTTSSSFNVALPILYDPGANGMRDAFVAKVTPDGSAFAYVNYIGGNRDDASRGVAVDGDGSAYITGSTFSTDFPVSPQGTVYDSVPPALGGMGKAYVFKLDPSGSLRTYATFLKAVNAAGRSIVVDGGGHAVVAGSTVSIAAVNAYNTWTGGGLEAFVIKLAPLGNSVSYATYLGGNGIDLAYGVDTDPSGRYAYVTGSTKSSNFPTTTGGSYQGSEDAFVAKLDLAVSGAASLMYSQLVGGTGTDLGLGVAADSYGNAIVVGQTKSPVMPAFGTLMGAADGFLAKIGPTGTLGAKHLVGGLGADGLHSVAVDGRDNVYVVGNTNGTLLIPQLNGVSGTSLSSANHGGTGGDAFVIKFPPTMAFPTYGGYFGGTADDVATDIAVDWGGFTYLIGVTYSSGLSTNGIAYETSWDTFFVKIGPQCTWVGTPLGDTMALTNNIDDVICALDGNDSIITTGSGNDIVVGGDGDDRIATGGGNDTVEGGPGDDEIGTGNGDDMVFGNSGNDMIFTGEDNDAADGGTGNDHIEGGWGRNFLRGGGGADTLVNSPLPGIADGGGPSGIDNCTGSLGVVEFC